GLGFARGTTPFDELPARLEFPVVFPDLRHAVCGSGDAFVTGEPAVDCEVVDMEAYALAKVCTLERATFACVKYVTDGADHAAGDDWQANLHRAAERFIECYRTLTERSDGRRVTGDEGDAPSSSELNSHPSRISLGAVLIKAAMPLARPSSLVTGHRHRSLQIVELLRPRSSSIEAPQPGAR